jgi:signal transduction histidine kinase
LNHQLEDTVTERTKELRQKNKKLSMQDEQRSRLMANIAHDMGSPILGVQSSLHILAVEELTKKDEKTLVELMLRKVNYVKHLIDDLFQLAKLESRQSNFQWEIVTVTDFETEIEERFRGLLKETENRMNVVRSEGVEISGAPAKVRVDRYQLFRVLQNLMDNALKFSRGQQTEIVFRSVVQVAGDGSQRRQEWLVEIVDDGIGIASDQLPRLFERFYTRNPGVPEGSGLGLAIVKETIELHGGTVGVRSELGEGSTFYFVLPCVSQVES